VAWGLSIIGHVPAEPQVLAALTEAVQRQPDAIPLRLHLASLLLESGADEQALGHYLAVLDREPEHQDALLGAVKAAQALGDGKGAALYRARLNTARGTEPVPAQGPAADEDLETEEGSKTAGRAWWDVEASSVTMADVGDSGPARWVVDGYQTLFAEAREQAAFDVLLVPVGAGSLAAAAARFGAAAGVAVIGVEPETAACLTASLAAGRPTAVENPGTTMAGLDCAEISPTAWPSLRNGIQGTVTVADSEVHAAMRELAALGLRIGDCGASTLAALRALATEDACAALSAAAGVSPATRLLLVASEGVTDPEGYARALAGG